MTCIKHLMTGPKGNSEFCFPRDRQCSVDGETVEGKQNSLFPLGPVIKCFGYTSQLNNRTYDIRVYLLDAGRHINLPRFQGARPDHVRVESSSCCFPRELVSFVRPRELVSFDLWHVTRSPPIGERI